LNSQEKKKLLSSSVLQLVVGVGLAAGTSIALADISFAATPTVKKNPTAVAKIAGAKANPTAVRSNLIQLAACGAKKKSCNPCTPCGAKKKACNPCAAKKGCNPCAAKKGCNPCAAKKGCNPCATKKACNPCAAKKGCNPCAANACNPCAGGGGSTSAKCMVPRLVQAALRNPCAAKKGCNPCAAKKGCNPCAAKKGCNPCAAKKGCNPCGGNPCGGGGSAELKSKEAQSVYDCLRTEMIASYSKSGHKDAKFYKDWGRYSTQPYVSDTHGERYVNNYANARAKNYGKFEKAGLMAVGAKMAKDSFVVKKNGKVSVGPLFMMEKMASGFNKASGNWRYTMVMPNGQLFGQTNGKNAKGMKFCYECHMAGGEDTDSMLFLPEDYRVK
jgi:hypothetical protein